MEWYKTAGALETLPSEVLKVEVVVERTHAPDSSSGLFRLETRLVEHIVKDLKRPKSFSSTDAAPFGYFHVLVKQSCMTRSRQYSTRMYERVPITSRALKSVRRAKTRVHGRAAGAFLSKQVKCTEMMAGISREMECAYR